MEPVDAAVSVSAPASPSRLAYPTIKESWGVLGWHLLSNCIVAILAVLVLKIGFHQNQTITGLAVVGISQPALLLFLRWKAGVRRQPLLLKGHEQLWLYAALPVLVLALVMVLSLLRFLHMPNWAGQFFKQAAQLPKFAFVIIVLTGPLFEELVVRGVVLQGLLRNYRPWVAIGQSALLFGIMHYNPAQSINALLLGLVFGWLYYRTRSLLLCITMHVLVNSLAFLGQVSSASGSHRASTLLTGSPWLYTGVVLLSVLVAGGILWRVQQTTSVEPEEVEPSAFLQSVDGETLV